MTRTMTSVSATYFGTRSDFQCENGTFASGSPARRAQVPSCSERIVGGAHHNSSLRFKLRRRRPAPIFNRKIGSRFSDDYVVRRRERYTRWGVVYHKYTYRRTLQGARRARVRSARKTWRDMGVAMSISCCTGPAN